MQCRTLFDPAVYPVPDDLLNLMLADGWQDVSQSYNLNLSFRHAGRGLMLYVHPADVADRTIGDPRFLLVTYDQPEGMDEGEGTIMEFMWATDDEAEAFARIAQLRQEAS